MPDTLSATMANGARWSLGLEPVGDNAVYSLRLEVPGLGGRTMATLVSDDLPVIADLLLRAAGAPDAPERAARSLVYAAQVARSSAAVLGAQARGLGGGGA